MERVSIAEIGKHVDSEVEIQGWLYNLRSKGKIAFLQLRDGTGRIQGVAEETACGADGFARIAGLKMEASVQVAGQGAPGPARAVGIRAHRDAGGRRPEPRE